jgi:hypothetical protein
MSQAVDYHFVSSDVKRSDEAFWVCGASERLHARQTACSREGNHHVFAFSVGQPLPGDVKYALRTWDPSTAEGPDAASTADLRSQAQPILREIDFICVKSKR